MMERWPVVVSPQLVLLIILTMQSYKFYLTFILFSQNNLKVLSLHEKDPFELV